MTYIEHFNMVTRMLDEERSTVVTGRHELTQYDLKVIYQTIADLAARVDQLTKENEDLRKWYHEIRMNLSCSVDAVRFL